MTPLVLNLKPHRERAGLTQTELAKAAGVRQATISDLETGKSRRVELDLLKRLAKVLGVKASALLEHIPENPSESGADDGKAEREGPAVWRERGGAARAYGDFRDFGDAGGRREPLIPPGERVATTTADVAQVLIASRLKELEAIRRERQLLGVRKRATLFDYARLHLIAKANAGKVTDRWLRAAELYLGRAVEYFGTNRNLAAITVEDVRKWTDHLRSLPSRRGGLTTGGTARHHLNALSNLYRRAQGEGVRPARIQSRRRAHGQADRGTGRGPLAGGSPRRAVARGGSDAFAATGRPRHSVPLSAGGHLPSHGRPARRSVRARSVRCELRPQDRHLPGSRSPPPQDRHVGACGAALAAT